MSGRLRQALALIVAAGLLAVISVRLAGDARAGVEPAALGSERADAVLRASSGSRPAAGTAVGTTADNGATVMTETWLPGGRTVDLAVRSPAVGRTLPVRVLVPVGWSPTAARTWPVTMMLHGGNDDYTSWTRETDIAQLSADWDTIAVMPDAGLNATYTDYLRPLGGEPLQWETFHTVELRQILERAFRAGTAGAVAGISAGGYGALNYATRNPGMFRFAASYSGLIAILMPVVTTGVWAMSGDSDLDARFGAPGADRENWRLHDPYTQAERLRGTGVYLSSGLTGLPGDVDVVPWTPLQMGEAVTGMVTAAFAERLRGLGIPATVNLYGRGAHDWASWQVELRRSWPLMMNAIGARQRPGEARSPATTRP